MRRPVIGDADTHRFFIIKYALNQSRMGKRQKPVLTNSDTELTIYGSLVPRMRKRVLMPKPVQ